MVVEVPLRSPDPLGSVKELKVPAHLAPPKRNCFGGVFILNCHFEENFKPAPGLAQLQQIIFSI